MRARLIAVSALAVLIFACRAEVRSVTKPPTSAVPESVVERAVSGDTSVKVVLGPTVFRLGSEPGSHPAEFGWVVAVEFMSDGGIVVLDPINFRVTRFGSDGEVTKSLGRRGGGPGEMTEPTAMSQLDSSTLLVLDAVARRLNRYDVSGGSLKFVSADQLVRWPDGICSINGTAVGLEYDRKDGTILHPLTAQATLQAGIGTPWFDDAMMNDTGTMGLLSCATDQQLIVVASDRTGDVFAYGVNGSLRWRTHLRDYQASLFKRTPGGTMVGFGPDQKYRDVTIGLVRLSDNFLVVQTGTVLRGTRVIDSVSSHLLRLNDGVEVGTQRDLPRMRAASRGKIALSGEDEDVWVEVRSFHIEHDARTTKSRR